MPGDESSAGVCKVESYCSRDAVHSGLCKYHLIRQKLGGASVGDEIYVNGYGPLMIRRKTEMANNDGNYTDTKMRLVGNEDDGSLLRMQLWFNDSGRRGTGRPGYCPLDDDGNRKGANQIHQFRFAEVPENQEIVAENTAGDLLDELR